MRTQFSKLFELQLRHEFYADGVCRDLEVQPSVRTRLCLQGSRWVFKNRMDGFVIATSPSSPAAGHDSLVFFLGLRNPEFSYFTDVAPPDSMSSIRVFRPPTAKLPGSVDLTTEYDRLEKREADGKPIIRTQTESLGTWRDAAEALAMPSLYGIIYLPPDSLRIAAPVTAKLTFAARQAFWVYRCLGRTDVKILDEETSDALKISFAKDLRTGAAENSAFKSTKKVPCSEAPRRKLFLSCGSRPGQTRLLPNPPLNSLSGCDTDFTLTQIIPDNFIARST